MRVVRYMNKTLHSIFSTSVFAIAPTSCLSTGFIIFLHSHVRQSLHTVSVVPGGPHRYWRKRIKNALFKSSTGHNVQYMQVQSNTFLTGMLISLNSTN